MIFPTKWAGGAMGGRTSSILGDSGGLWGDSGMEGTLFFLSAFDVGRWQCQFQQIFK